MTQETSQYFETTTKAVFRTTPVAFPLNIESQTETHVTYQTEIPFDAFYNQHRQITLQGFQNDRLETNYQGFEIDQQQPWTYRIHIESLSYEDVEGNTLEENGSFVESHYYLNKIAQIGHFQMTDLMEQLTLEGELHFDPTSQSIKLKFTTLIGKYPFKNVHVSLDFNFIKTVKFEIK